ncbi:MAG: GNAT family N-acetyltransferase [Ruminococcus flavefaciens]|nr:GNAT family N-acetyltransferase [Ruminococcus flavefaciens]
MVKIRVMTPDDWDGVAEVWENHEGTNPVDDSIEGFTKYLRRNPSTSFVAVDDGRIIGTILAGHDGRRGIFHHVSVLPEYQKQGVGKMLVDNAMEALRKEGITKVLLVVFNHNENGNQFWEHMGFTVREDLIYRNKCTNK